MLSISEIELYTLLKPKLGEKEAKILVEYVESKIDNQTEKRISEYQKTLASKQDIVEVKSDILEIHTKIAETKAELLKWMIVLFAPFYVGMIVFLIKQFI
jgi:hypothetical protein